MLWTSEGSSLLRGFQRRQANKETTKRRQTKRSKTRCIEQEEDNQNGNEASHFMVYLSGLFFNFLALLFLVWTKIACLWPPSFQSSAQALHYFANFGVLITFKFCDCSWSWLFSFHSAFLHLNVTTIICSPFDRQLAINASTQILRHLLSRRWLAYKYYLLNNHLLLDDFSSLFERRARQIIQLPVIQSLDRFVKLNSCELLSLFKNFYCSYQKVG